MRSIVLGADAGTHGIRILALEIPSYQLIAQSKSEYTRNCKGDIQELVVEDLENAFFGALRSLKLPADAEIMAFGITHQRGTVIPVDQDGNPLANAFCDSDARVLDSAGFLEYGIHPAEYYHTTGCPIVSFNGFAKILWCRKYMPDLYQKAAAWLSPQDFLLSRLLGHLQLTEGSLLRNGQLNILTRQPEEAFFRDTEVLRHYTRVGECCGVVSKKWNADFPQLAKTLLFAVPGDQPAAVLAACAIDSENMYMNLGTSFVVSKISDTVPSDNESVITTEILPFQKFAPEYGTGAGGQFMDFLTGLVYEHPPDTPEHWDQLDSEVGKIPAGAEGLSITPLLWNATTKGVKGKISGMMPFHHRAGFFRAAYEGLAFEAKIAVEKIAANVHDSDGIIVFGGMSGGDSFMQILASVTNKTVTSFVITQASAFGAAIGCCIGLGIMKTMEDVKRAAGSALRVFYPLPNETLLYEELYRLYREQRR